MKNPKADSWADAYTALFGRPLSVSEAAAWSNEIVTAFEGRTRPWPGEAAKALRTLAASWPTDSGYPPTARDLISAMKAGRRKAVEEVGGHKILFAESRMLPNGARDVVAGTRCETVGDWQRELRECGPEERWAVICRPASNDQCRERESFCARQGLEFVRFVPRDNYVGVIGQEVARE